MTVLPQLILLCDRLIDKTRFSVKTLQLPEEGDRYEETSPAPGTAGAAQLTMEPGETAEAAEMPEAETGQKTEDETIDRNTAEGEAESENEARAE